MENAFRIPSPGAVRGPRRVGGSGSRLNSTSSNNNNDVSSSAADPIAGGVGSDLTRVIATNDDASATKLSAINKGYYQDPFVQYFVEGTSLRQPPLMNRGYYSRVVVLRTLVRDFIAMGGKQIVNLGAGFDTTFFVLYLENTLPNSYFEVDLPQVVRNKTRVIRNQEVLRRCLPDDSYYTEEGIHSPRYHLISADLRDVSQLSELLLASGLDKT